MILPLSYSILTDSSLKSSRPTFAAIDILRGFAALSVLVHHVIELGGWSLFPTAGPLVWFRIGWMGVDLFFVISGFVIALSAFAGIERDGPSNFRGSFMKKRLLRIVPLHYLTMLVFLVFITPELLFERFWINLLSHLFFVHNFHFKLHGGINGANWSLATEMQFYLLIAIVAPWLKSTAYWKFSLLFIAIAVCWRWAMIALFPPDPVYATFPLFVAATQLPGMLDEFAIGILLARLFLSARFASFIQRCRQPGGLLVVIIAVTFSLSLIFSIFWSHSNFWDNKAMVIFFRTGLAISFGALVFLFCLIKISGIWSLILKPFTYLGVISFGIYLWHLPVLLSLKRIKWLPPQDLLMYTILITCLFAALSWHFFEKPFLDSSAEKREKNLIAS